jgi:predicted dehydrogenase
LGRLLSPRVAAFSQGARSRCRRSNRGCEAGPIAAIRSATGAERLRRWCLPWRVDPALSGGGFFFEAVCHTFDFLDFLFGPIEDLHGIAGNKAGAWRPEDTVVASYRFASGVFGCGTWCYAADDDFEMNEIIGSRGSPLFSTSDPLPIRLVRGGQTEEIAIADPPHVHQPLIQSIVDELNGVGRCPSTGESGARTAAVMDRLLAGFLAGPRR